MKYDICAMTTINIIIERFHLPKQILRKKNKN